MSVLIKLLLKSGKFTITTKASILFMQRKIPGMKSVFVEGLGMFTKGTAFFSQEMAIFEK